MLIVLVAVSAVLVGSQAARVADNKAVNVDGIRWELVSRGQSLPEDAIRGGFQRTGDTDNPHYVGRVFFNNTILPATVTKYDKFYAYTGLGTTAVTQVEDFEVACADRRKVRWLAAGWGDVPQVVRSVAAPGIAEDGSPLYVCRVFDRDLAVGSQHFMMTVGVLKSYCKRRFQNGNGATMLHVDHIAFPSPGITEWIENGDGTDYLQKRGEMWPRETGLPACYSATCITLNPVSGVCLTEFNGLRRYPTYEVLLVEP